MKRSYGTAFKVGATAISMAGSYLGNRYGPRYRKARYTVVPQSASTEHYKYRSRYGRVRRRTARTVFKNLLGSGTQVVNRWQNMSETLAGFGRLPIGYGTQSAAAANECVPIMFMSLTTNEGILGNTVTNANYGAYGHGLSRLFFDNTTGAFKWVKLASQTNVGINSFDLNGDWKNEQNYVSGNFGYQKLFHKYTDIRLNFYGSEFYPLEYTATVLMLPEDLDPYKFAENTDIANGTECEEMLKDMVRPLIKNPININNRSRNWRSKVKVVCKRTFRINPVGSANAGLREPLSNKVVTCKMFLRHDRYRDYNYADGLARTTVDNSLSDLGWDVYKAGRMKMDVDFGKRLFLFITCTAGERYLDDSVTPATDYFRIGSPADLGIPQTGFQKYCALSGSMDVLVRNAFIVPGTANVTTLPTTLQDVPEGEVVA